MRGHVACVFPGSASSAERGYAAPPDVWFASRDNQFRRSNPRNPRMIFA